MKKSRLLFPLLLLTLFLTVASTSWEYSFEPLLVNASPQQSPDCSPPLQAKKVVYLTFDDGPSKVTAEVLDMLKEKNVKATFFVTGNNNEEYQPLMKRMVDEGHTVAIHSYTHNVDRIYDSMDEFIKDFNKINQLIQEQTGTIPKIYRFPGGSQSYMIPNETLRTHYTSWIKENGYIYYDWTAVSGDDTRTVYPADYLANNILNESKDKDIVVPLFHDAAICTTTPEAAGIVIDRLVAEGYVFEPITENSQLVQFALIYPK